MCCAPRVWTTSIRKSLPSILGLTSQHPGYGDVHSGSGAVRQGFGAIAKFALAVGLYIHTFFDTLYKDVFNLNPRFKISGVNNYWVLTLNLTLSDPLLNREPVCPVNETFTQQSHRNCASFAQSKALNRGLRVKTSL